MLLVLVWETSDALVIACGESFAGRSEFVIVLNSRGIGQIVDCYESDNGSAMNSLTTSQTFWLDPEDTDARTSTKI